MRILFVAAPLIGHLYPMIPLAEALRAAGNDVLVASGGDAAARPPAGFPVEDVVGPFNFGRIALGTMLSRPRLLVRELAGRAGTDAVGHIFGAVNDRFLGATTELVGRWRPDVVVHEPLAGAGAVAAARHDVPTVLHGNTLFDDALLLTVTTAKMRPRIDVPASGAVLRISPDSLVPGASGQPMRPVGYGGGATLPSSLREPASRPRILVSHSTIVGPGSTAVLDRIVRLAPSVDAEFVLIRAADRLAGRTLPPNVRAIGWAPLPEALETASAIVHHGGAGTIFAALAAGVPQLVTPGPGDRAHNAHLVAARGAGLAVPMKRIDADAVRRLVEDPSLRAASAEVATEIAAMPAPTEIAATVFAKFA
ncbi:glucosyl transferase [Asanoa ishikariensis]|uniref:UDP:flavonoid glycosyltransferase YjiC, YdhE family n=1 Tax=Asanoa ishikariensis TaxID=137265 RepID=A0A1H3PCU6_9ACTN|nr:glycosyltransferase [Asanoa ishikariensis]GIF67904.1 glucosyl transferase [Asanoa ishikariensis]SDY98964.1 UDP:flavonoid glycosyltransferase YjiC, YdhE family [Asanoa ishikariensis]